MKTAIIVDSTAQISQEFKNRDNVFQVNLTVNFANGDILEDSGRPEDYAAFYQRLSQEKELPTTSQPTLGQYYDVMDEIVDQGFQRVIAIHISSQLSGTLSTAQTVMDEYKDKIECHAYDSLSASKVVAIAAYKTADMLDQEASMAEIDQMLKQHFENQYILLVVDTLTNLVKGGRLSTAAGLIGGLMQIKPILEINKDGTIAVSEKVRTRKKAYDRLFTSVQERTENLGGKVKYWVLYTGDEAPAQAMQEKLQATYPNASVELSPLTFTIGVHTGNGVVGVCVIADK